MSASDLHLASFFQSRPVDQPPGRGLLYRPAFPLFSAVNLANSPEKRFSVSLFLTAIPSAIRWPITTTIFAAGDAGLNQIASFNRRATRTWDLGCPPLTFFDSTGPRGKHPIGTAGFFAYVRDKKMNA